MGDELHGRNNQIIDYTKKNVNKLSIREGSFKKKNQNETCGIGLELEGSVRTPCVLV